MNNKYLLVIIALMSWMIFDQARALKELTQLTKTYETTINDYWVKIQSCK